MEVRGYCGVCNEVNELRRAANELSRACNFLRQESYLGLHAARARKLKPPEKVEDRNMRWWEKSLQKREQAYLRSEANPDHRALDDI